MYDNEGNLVRKTDIASGVVTEYVWDYRDRLTEVAYRPTLASAVYKRVKYFYDAFDRRIGKTVDYDGNGTVDRTFLYVFDGDNEVLVLLDNDGTGPDPFRYSKRIMQGDGLDDVLAEEQWVPGSGPSVSSSFPSTQFGATMWLFGDALGSIRDVMDGAGVIRHRTRYDSFGNRTYDEARDVSGGIFPPLNPAAVDSLFGYTGRDWDSDTQLQNNRARWYDPKLGRWLSQDPISFAGGDANLYRYAGNGPTGASDPIGLVIIWVDGIKTTKKNTHAESVAKALRDYSTANGFAEQAFLYFDFPEANDSDGRNTGAKYDKKVAPQLKKLIDSINDANVCGEPVYLVGFSNGTDIARLALESGAKVDGLVFLGSAVDRDTDLQDMMTGTAWFYNYWSNSDYVAGTFANGMGARNMRELGNIKNSSLPGVTIEEVFGLVHTEKGGDILGDEVFKSKNKDERVPWTSYYAGYVLLGKLLLPNKQNCLSVGGEIVAPDGTKVKLKPGYQTIPSGIEKR